MDKKAPTIHFEEFQHYSTPATSQLEFIVEERNHPDFGNWSQKSLNLGRIKIFQHQANLHRDVNVFFDDGALKENVHHCISVDGHMGAHFRNQNFTAFLNTQSYHQVYVHDEEYTLSMGDRFNNVHIEIEREYYSSLLSESEHWAYEVRKKIADHSLYYPGEFHLSQQMLLVIHDIFNSPLTGYLKRLLIEAKVHELIALQLGASELTRSAGNEKHSSDQFFAIREFLDKTFLYEHSLQSIAKEFGLNECSLKKGFKANFNTTVFDYLLSKRLDHARELLLSTSHSIQEIGTITGYKYPNHFSVAFKKKFGVSPATLRA